MNRFIRYTREGTDVVGVERHAQHVATRAMREAREVVDDNTSYDDTGIEDSELASCPHCGAPIGDDGRYAGDDDESLADQLQCPHCGAPVRHHSAASSLDEMSGDSDALDELEADDSTVDDAASLSAAICPFCARAFALRESATTMPAHCSGCGFPFSIRDLHLSPLHKRRLREQQQQRQEPRRGGEPVY